MPNPANPQSWNRFAYVNNNPISFNDPTGHYEEEGCSFVDEDCDEENFGGPSIPIDPVSDDEDDDDPSLLDSYLLGWENFGSAWSTSNDPNSNWLFNIYSTVYILGWGGAHAGLLIGGAGLACVAAGPSCVMAVEGALGIGGALSADGDPTNEIRNTTAIIAKWTEIAKEQYPKLANKANQLHHIFPKYLGGDPKGPMVSLNPAYHQLITNEFRALWAYGQNNPTVAEAQRIMQLVYDKFPLP